MRRDNCNFQNFILNLLQDKLQKCVRNYSFIFSLLITILFQQYQICLTYPRN